MHEVGAIVILQLLSCQKWPPATIFCKVSGYKIARLGSFASGSVIFTSEGYA